MSLLKNIPEELKAYHNWVGWKWEKKQNTRGRENWTKPPYDLKSNGTLRHADTTNPATWAPFEIAEAECSSFEPRFDGGGFVLPPGLGGVDFDGVIVDEKPEPFVREILKHLGNPYCEITPSDNGLRAIINVPTLPADKRRKFHGKKPGVDKYGAEIYFGVEPGRYLTITGRKFSGNKISTPPDIDLVHVLMSQIGDEKFKKLWMGDFSDYGDDQSAADFTLISMLARLLNKDAKRIEKYFSGSILGQRDKWTQRADYRERTIAKALESTSVGESRKFETSKVLHPIIQASRESAEKFDMDSIRFDPAMKHAEHEPIFQGFLTVGDSALVIGAKKAEKSLFGLRWAMHIACGKTWCGFACTRPRRVAYLDGENDLQDVSDRYHLLLGEFSSDQQQLIRPNLVVVCGRQYTDAGGSLDYLSDHWWDNYAKQTKDCEVHFLDCLYLFHDKESYDNSGLREVMDVLRYRINSMGSGRTVVMLHHSRSMSNDDLRSVDKLSLERLGPMNFSETSFGGKVLLKNATLVVCLDKQSKRDEDGEIESQAIYFQFYGRRVPESPLLKFEPADEKFARRLVRALSKGARKSVMDLRMARGDSGSWESKHEAAKDLKCARSNAYCHLDEMIAKEYLVPDGGRYHLRLTAELNIEITRVEEHNAAHDAATKWLRQYVTHPMKAENVIEVGDEEGYSREDLIEARRDAGLIEEPVTDASMGSILMWRPKKQRGAFKKGSDLAKQAAEKRWTKPEEQAELPMASSDPGAGGSPAVEVGR